MMEGISNKLINKATILFYLFGLAFLFFAAKTWLENSQADADQSANKIAKIEPYVTIQEAFHFDEFINSKGFAFFDEKIETQDDKILALYVLTTNACTPCLSELFRYSELLDELGLAGKPVQHLAIVIDKEKRRAERFVKTTDLSILAAYYKGGKYAEFLLLFQQSRTQGQLILVDNNTKRLFFRAVISTSYGASDDDRLNILYEAEKAYDRM